MISGFLAFGIAAVGVVCGAIIALATFAAVGAFCGIVLVIVAGVFDGIMDERRAMRARHAEIRARQAEIRARIATTRADIARGARPIRERGRDA